MEDKIKVLNKGLNTDSSYLNQPEGTYPFALNAVMESNEGDFYNLSNENSNVLKTHIKQDFVLIGSVYIGDGEVCLFTVKNDNSESEIGIFNGNKYTVWCNDKLSDENNKLNFRVDKQIQAIYKLRRGCEKNVYWTDNYNIVRHVNLSDYKNYTIYNNETKLNVLKFNLIKNINNISNPITDIEVKNVGGSLKNGSIKVFIRFVDKYDNYTRFFWESCNYLIYKSSLKKEWEDIFGDLSVQTEPQETTKSLKINFDFSNIKDYNRFQLGFLTYTSGTGQPTEVFYSNILSTRLKSYTFSGTNYLSKGTVEELMLAQEEQNIEKVKTLSFKDDRLLIGNVKSKYEDYTGFQKFASKIKTDLIYKKEYINVLSKHNPKNPEQHEIGVGVIPGEVYSLGISYVFEDNTETPVFHIPGPTGEKIILDNTFNDSEYTLAPLERDFSNSNLYYSQKNNCTNSNYYGQDYLGNVLDENTNMRFHKVPFEKDLNVELQIKEEDIISYNNLSNIDIKYLNDYYNNFEIVKLENQDVRNYGKIEVVVNINNSERFWVDSNSLILNEEILNDSPINLTFPIKISFILKTLFKEETINTLDNQVINTRYLDFNGQEISTPIDNYKGFSLEANNNNNSTIIVDDNTSKKITELQYIKKLNINNPTGNSIINLKEEFFIYNIDEKEVLKIDLKKNVNKKKVQEKLICGFHFSNIELPNNPKKPIVGYNIYKQVKSENDKIILDEVFLIPTCEKNKYVGGQIFQDSTILKPRKGYETQESDTKKSLMPSKFEDGVFNLLSMKHKFFDNEFTTASKLVIDRVIGIDKLNKDAFFYQDVADSGAEPTGNSNYDDKDDGLDFKMMCRDVYLKSPQKLENPIVLDISDFYLLNLEPYSYYVDSKTGKTIINLDFINKNMFLVLEENGKNLFNTIPYKNVKPFDGNINTERFYYKGYFINENRTFFENIEVSSFEKLNSKILTSNKANSFNFDSYSGAFSMSSISYGRFIPKRALNKGSAIKFITAGALLLTGIFASIFFPPAGLGLIGFVGGILTGAAGLVLGTKAVLDIKALEKILGDFWDKGVNAISLDRELYGFCVGLDNEKDIRLGQDNIVTYSGWVINDIIFNTDFNFTLLPEKSINGKTNLMKPFSNKLYQNTKKFEQYDHNIGSDSIFESNAGSNPNLATLKSFMFRRGNGDGDFDSIFYSSTLNRNWTNPDSITAKYFEEKVLKESYKRKENKELYGPNSNEYFCNKDYWYIPNIKKNYLYRVSVICSKCEEEFPNRWYWSEKDYSETINSSYNIFKPNNYKDLSGEYGNITNLFTYGNNLFIHTTDGLWIQPTNPQEQKLSDVTVYIGTGEFGSLPAQLVIDDKSGTSAGLQHREAQIVTPYGYFFVSEKERKIYKFDGKLTPISDIGMSKWFNSNIELKLNTLNKSTNSLDYLYNDNPSNNIGIGFIMTYDKERERILVTKKDFISIEPLVNNSWTLSFSLKTNTWVSFHSYIPNQYFRINNKYFSWVYGNSGLYEHNKDNEYQKFYENKYPYIIEYVSNDNPVVTKIFDHIRFLTEAYKYDNNTKEFYNERFITFNKSIIYNSRQCSGELNLKVKDITPEQQEYLKNQIVNENNNVIFLDRNEKDWLLNDFRDYRTDYNKPIWNKENNTLNLNTIGFIDKILNNDTIDLNKEWYELESFRDKYLVVRLSFDNFANDIKLIFSFSSENKTISNY